MSMLEDFERSLSQKELKVFHSLNSPSKIQAFLDKVTYCDEDVYRSPLSVLRRGKACCLDGALLAAAALMRLEHPPLIVEMIADDDDDHIIAIYKRNGFFGAIAKSNFVGLRFREAVYRNLRELVMSYFEFYYNLGYKKTLRAYSAPLNLRAFDRIRWMGEDTHLEAIAERLDEIRKFSLLTPYIVRSLSPVDKRTYKAGMLGADLSQVYKPCKRN